LIFNPLKPSFSIDAEVEGRPVKKRNVKISLEMIKPSISSFSLVHPGALQTQALKPSIFSFSLSSSKSLQTQTLKPSPSSISLSPSFSVSVETSYSA